MLLEDKIVIVSGIGPWPGRELAPGAAREGASVVLAARTVNAALFFASDLSRVITGANLDVNGGEFMP